MSTYLNKTISTSTDNNKFTISVWIKRTELSSGSYRAILTSQLSGASTTSVGLWFRNDSIAFLNETSSSGYNENVTTAVYRDVNSWYHIVIAGDTSQSGTDKLKFYVNGEQITSFSTDNRSSFVGIQYSLGHTGYDNYIGRKYDGSYQFYGIMSHYHFVDGTALTSSTFGSTDSTTGEWKINTNPSVTYGNNGFFILKDGNSVTDQSGNSNNWTANGNLTKTEDCPSNVFATLNNLNQTNSNATFSNGNNTLAVSGNWLGAASTIGVFKGKWYFEAKSDGNNWGMGVAQIGQRFTRTTEISTANTGYFGKYNDTWSFYNNGNSPYKLTNDTGSAYGSDFANGDIGMFALDADNGKIWAGKNGTWFESGDPANGTNAMYDSLDNSYGWLVGVFGENSTTQANFGNGYFGTTAVSSAGTNASNLGIFEYDVPAGFTAICTKGLNL